MQNRDERFIAHRREDGKTHPLIEHLKTTAERAGSFAEVFGAGAMAKAVGLCHDVGKYSDKFQRHIKGQRQRIDHATPGAQMLLEQDSSILGITAAYCIMGHHGGLPDGGGTNSNPDDPTLYGRRKRTVDDCSTFRQELTLPPLIPPNIALRDGFGAAFFIRMLFSALVDADRLDAERFMLGETPRGGGEDIAILRDRLLTQIKHLIEPVEPLSDLNTHRTTL